MRVIRWRGHAATVPPTAMAETAHEAGAQNGARGRARRAATLWLRSALLLLIAGAIAKLLGFGGVAAVAAFLAWSMLLVTGVRLVIRLLEEHLPPIA